MITGRVWRSPRVSAPHWPLSWTRLMSQWSAPWGLMSRSMRCVLQWSGTVMSPTVKIDQMTHSLQVWNNETFSQLLTHCLVRRPKIVLTSEDEDGVRMSHHLQASMDILSRKLLKESLETVAVIQQYSDKIPSPETSTSPSPSSSTRMRSSR